MAVLCLLAATLPWWIATTCRYIVLDDDAYIVGNAHVTHGLTLQGLGWAFSNTESGFWIPLTWLSLMLDVSLFGPGPVGIHFTNVLLHIANALLVYFVLCAATRMPGRSLVVALLFAVHPLRVESVAWAIERKDVLSVSCGLAAMWCYVRYAHRGGIRWHLAACGFFVLSVAAKPLLVTMPFLLLLLDFWPLDRIRAAGIRRVLLEKIPLGVAATVACVVTYIAQIRTNTHLYEAIKPLPERLANAAVSYVLYLRDCVYFGGLALFYPWKAPTPVSHWLPAMLLLVAITVLLLWAAIRKVRWRAALVGWLWFLGTLVPMIGVVQSGNQSRADRFTYFPSIGILIAIVFVWPEVSAQFPRRRRISLMLATTAAFALVVCMTVQLWLWRDPLTLYRTTVERTRDNWFIETFVAQELQQRGQYDAAIACYRDVVRLAPFMHQPENNLGGLLAKQGRLEEALVHLKRAHELEPGNATYAGNYERVRQYLARRAAATLPAGR